MKLEPTKMGRPTKPTAEKFIGRLIKAPPRLWERLDAQVPERCRAQFIRDALEDALRRVRENDQ